METREATVNEINDDERQTRQKIAHARSRMQIESSFMERTLNTFLHTYKEMCSNCRKFNFQETFSRSCEFFLEIFLPFGKWSRENFFLENCK